MKAKYIPSKIIERGDVVFLEKLYKPNDYQYNNAFISALNEGFLPDTFEEKQQIYSSWEGFNYGIVNDILSTKADGSPLHVSLFLYYQQPNGVWLFYGLKQGVPTFVDFNTKYLTLIHKSSAPDYVSGNITLFND